MTTYQAAYAQTVANIYDRMTTLRQTLMTLQKTLDVPDKLWSRLYPTQRRSVRTADKNADLYVESQVKLNYLIDLLLFIERDQVQALPEELDDFFVTRDLYWWESTLSLIGRPAYLEHELIAPAYYELAQKTTVKTISTGLQGVACPTKLNSAKKMNEP